MVNKGYIHLDANRPINDTSIINVQPQIRN